MHHFCSNLQKCDIRATREWQRPDDYDGVGNAEASHTIIVDRRDNSVQNFDRLRVDLYRQFVT